MSAHGPVYLFASKHDALVAARLEAEGHCADWLSEIDSMISGETI